MKRTFCLLLLLISFQTLSFAQTKDEKQVAAAVESFRQAMIDADKKILEEITAPELTYGHSNGNIEDKKAFIEVLTSGKSDYTAIDLTGQTIQVVNNTAIVRHNLSAKTNSGGKPGTLVVDVIMVWQKHKGKWVLLARQGFKKPI